VLVIYHDNEGAVLLYNPSQEDDDMGRRRYQRPSVQRSVTRRPYWFIRYRDYSAGGVEKTAVLGWCDEMGLRAAQKARDALLEPVNHAPAAVQAHTPIAEFARTYGEVHLSTVRPATRQQAESELRHHLLPAFGTRRLCDLRREDVQRWANGLDLAKGSRTNLVRRLHHIYEEADRLGYWQGRNPATKIRLAGETLDRELITIVQYRALLALMPDPWSLAVRVAAETGLRIGEIRGLRKEDIDVAAAQITVRRQLGQLCAEGPTKTRRSNRTVAMGDLAGPIRELAQWRKPGEYLFPVLAYSTLRSRLVGVARKAGITARRFGWHSLRALYATLARDTGADALDLRDTLGHSDMETTGRYALVSPSRAATITQAVQERLKHGK